jgi:hypothetical protein
LLDHPKDADFAFAARHFARAGRGLAKDLEPMRPHVWKAKATAMFPVVMGWTIVSVDQLKGIKQGF